MPSGKTHDAITILLAAPLAAGGYYATQSLIFASSITAAFLFGGLMFGPDLDTVSIQSSRWGIFRFFWYPYRVFFKHRSRWSHGLVFGTLFRVIYFMGVCTLVSFVAAYFAAMYLGGDLPRLAELTTSWQMIGNTIRRTFGENAIPAVFVGMWLGAASHTVTDMSWSYIKTGRITEFL